jgi:hypothetical protein
VITEFIKVMPPTPETEIREIIVMLVKTQDKQILCNLIEPIILLGKISNEESTVGYLKSILESSDPAIICTVLKKYGDLSAVFPE